MEEQLQEISRLISAIRTYLLEAGLQTPSIAYKKRKLENAKYEEVNHVRAWLVGFQKGYCGGVDHAKKLVPQSVWDMYKNTGLKNSFEQRQLRIAYQLLRDEWAKRPELLRRRPKCNKQSKKTSVKSHSS